MRSKGFILLIFMIIFSFGILGQVDTRMHIGGGDWDFENLVYIDIDDFLVEGETYYPRADSLTSGETGKPEAQAEPSQAENEPAALEEEVHGAESESTLAEGESAPIQESSSEPETPPMEEKKEKKPTIFVHKVHSGETLWDIAQAYGITVDTILSANDLQNPNMIRVGQELHILSVPGVLHRVVVGENLWEIAERYKVSVDEITKANEIRDPGRIQPSDRLYIPGATRLMPRDVLVVNGQLQKAFDWPVRGRISSPFGPRWGKMHNGLDIAVVTGTPVKAAADGKVTFAGMNGGYGILVVLDHGSGVETRYAHNSRLNVKSGQKVDRGQVIAFSGNTGVSTGPHVHFEIRYRNNPVNPQTYLR